jgi:glutaredoxin
MKFNFIYPSDTWTIYSKSNCLYCTQVKKLLEKESFTIINCDIWLEEQETKNLFLASIEKLIGKKYNTFPIVFYNSIFIGGFLDTEKYLSNKKIIITDDF